MQTKTKKIIAIVIAIVVIMVLIIGWFLSKRTQPLPQQDKVQPVIEDQSGAGVQSEYNITTWKTYTNEKLGFEIKYPASWFAIESDNENRVYFQNISKDSLKKPYPDNLRMIWISYDQKESDESNFFVTNSPDLVKYQTDVNGVSVNIYEDRLAETGEIFTDAFWKSKDNQLYSASTLGGEFATVKAAREANAEQNQILKKILSTFKFTK